MIDASIYINKIVTQINTSIFGEYDAGSGKTFVCDTKWARQGKIITDSNDVKFRITEIDYDNYIIAEAIDGSAIPLEGLIYLQNPFYITGTKLATNREWTIVSNNLENKTPLVWLLEIINEVGYGRESSIERDISTRLFFLDETDPAQYYTQDHRKQVVVPMQKLMEAFIEVVNNDRMYEPIDTYNYKTFSRFGVEQDTGVIENILDANLSGVALDLTLTRFKENCKC